MPPTPLDMALEPETDRLLAYASGLIGGSVMLTSAALLRVFLRRVGGLANARERCVAFTSVVAQQARDGEHHS